MNFVFYAASSTTFHFYTLATPRRLELSLSLFLSSATISFHEGQRGPLPFFPLGRVSESEYKEQPPPPFNRFHSS